MRKVAFLLCLLLAGFLPEAGWGAIEQLPEVGRLDMGGALPMGLDVAGGYAYVAARGGGLRVVDLSDPTAPRQVGGLVMPGMADQVQVKGSLAYVASESGGVQIVDVTRPTSPTLVGTAAVPGSAYALKVSGSRLYVGVGALTETDAASFIGLIVFDVTTPRSPVELGRLPINALGVPNPLYRSPTGVDVVGSHAYVSFGHAGTYIADVTTPAAMRLLSNFYAPQPLPDGAASNAVSVTVAKDVMYVGNR